MTNLEEIATRLEARKKPGANLFAEVASPSDIAYLLAEVKRLKDAFVQMHGCAGKAMNDWVDEQARAEDAEALALSLAEALERLTSMVAILPPDMDEPGSAIGQARSALSSPALLKLKGGK